MAKSKTPKKSTTKTPKTPRSTKAKDKTPKPEPVKKRPGRALKEPLKYEGPKFDMSSGTVEELPLEKLNLDDTRFQIRATTRPEKLVESIRSHGVLDPLVARPHPKKKGQYQLVSGFNRAQAATLAGLASVPVTVKELSDQDAFVFSYAENENRQSLNDLDRACAIQKLRESGAAETTADVASLFRIGERQVQRLEALLKYPKALQDAVAAENISTTHALVLNQAQQKYRAAFEPKKWLKRAIEAKLSVSQLRDEIKKEHRVKTPKKTLLRKRGDTVIFSRKYLADASETDRGKAIAELEKLLEELKG